MLPRFFHQPRGQRQQRHDKRKLERGDIQVVRAPGVIVLCLRLVLKLPQLGVDACDRLFELMPFVVERGDRLVGRLVFVLRCVKAATRILHCLPVDFARFAAALDAESLQVGDLGERCFGVAHALLKRALNFLLSLDSFFDPVKFRGQVVGFVQVFPGGHGVFESRCNPAPAGRRCR